MSSYIQKVLEAEKKRAGRDVKSRSHSSASKGLTESTGIFDKLPVAHVHQDSMEKNKILPSVADRKAITAYKILRTRVLLRMRTNKWRTLIITGAGSGEGKTMTASNLAVSISSDVNQSVVLVDLDLQRSTLASYFGLDMQASIGDYLLGKANIEDIVYAPEGIDRLAIIPNRDSIPNSSDLLSSPRMRELLEWIDQRGPNSLAIFDMPPVLACDDVLAFAPFADAILMVASEGLTDRSSLTKTMEMLGDRNLLGVVLNQSSEHDNETGYYG